MSNGTTNRWLQEIDAMPCRIGYSTACIFSTVGLVAQSLIPSTPAGIAVALGNLAVALVALVGAIRAMNREAARERRRDMLMEAKLKQSLFDPLADRQDLTERAVRNVRNKQSRFETTIKGLSAMAEVWGVKDAVKTPCLLIVDDDPATARTYAEFFKMNLNDPCILIATSVEQALVEIKKLPAWILFDIKLPDGNGLEIVPQALALNARTKVVCITGLADPQPLAAARAMGVEVIEKPVSKQDRTSLVRRLRNDFGVPAASSDAIPIIGPSGSRPGITTDESDG